LNDEEHDVFKRNKMLSSVCALSATALIPYFLISMLSLKYDHARWFHHMKIAGAGLMVAGAGFNVSCM
jgi:hypothetical protein